MLLKYRYELKIYRKVADPFRNKAWSNADKESKSEDEFVHAYPSCQ